MPPLTSSAISAEPAALLPDRFLQWFASRGWSPRAHQLALLAKAREDRSALLIAPTGAGKTLAGFLPTLVELSPGLPVKPATSKKLISTGRGIRRAGDQLEAALEPQEHAGAGEFALGKDADELALEDLEAQVVDALAEIRTLSLRLILRLIDLAAQLAHLILQCADPRQQLGDQIAAP